MRVCAMRTARVWLARERQESVYYYTSIRSGQHHGGNRRRNRRRPAAALHNLRCGWGRGLSADNWMWWPPINRVMDPSSDPVCIYPILPPDCCTETKCNPFPYKLLLGRFLFSFSEMISALDYSRLYRFGPAELLAKKKHKDMTKTFWQTTVLYPFIMRP
jgi:hypothetical protein